MFFEGSAGEELKFAEAGAEVGVQFVLSVALVGLVFVEELGQLVRFFANCRFFPALFHALWLERHKTRRRRKDKTYAQIRPRPGLLQPLPNILESVPRLLNQVLHSFAHALRLSPRAEQLDLAREGIDIVREVEELLREGFGKAVIFWVVAVLSVVAAAPGGWLGFETVRIVGEGHGFWVVGLRLVWTEVV